MFSETRYALNGDLRVAYRASREGPRDIVVVPSWFTCCEVVPELPSIQGWLEAMTSLGRIIFFDQAGIGASDPAPSGALPTLESWADSITAVLDDLGSREAVLLAVTAALPAALFAATHPSRATALVVLEGFAHPLTEVRENPAPPEQSVAIWGTGQLHHLSALTGLIDQLTTRRAELRTRVESSLETGQRSGREELDPRESAMLRELRGLDNRIAELRGELSRAELSSTTGIVGKLSRGINSAALLAPLTFGTEELRRLQTAALHGETCRLETRAPGFSTAEPWLPPELFEYPIAAQHESRILQRLPGIAMETSSIEFVRHVSTIGTPAPTAEGAVIPELQFVTDQLTLPAIKLAAHNALSWEVISDWPSFQSYCGTELYRQIIDAENEQILSGDGTAGSMVGFFATFGVLTEDATSVAPDTAIDHLEKAIAKLRTGPALAEADSLVLHPSTWSAIRRTKDAYERYLVSADPTRDEADQIWGRGRAEHHRVSGGQRLVARQLEIWVYRGARSAFDANRVRQRRSDPQPASNGGRRAVGVVRDETGCSP